MIKDELWPVARLIPISWPRGLKLRSIEWRRPCLRSSVPSQSLVARFSSLWCARGKSRDVIEVPFRLNTKSIRPDGIIVVTRAGKSWGAIVETKERHA